MIRRIRQRCRIAQDRWDPAIPGAVPGTHPRILGGGHRLPLEPRAIEDPGQRQPDERHTPGVCRFQNLSDPSSAFWTAGAGSNSDQIGPAARDGSPVTASTMDPLRSSPRTITTR